MTPGAGAAHAAIAAKPLALRAQAFATTAATCSPTAPSGNINNNDNRREVGPLQASAAGSAQTAAPTSNGANPNIAETAGLEPRRGQDRAQAAGEGAIPLRGTPDHVAPPSA
jgi:hypothetical protein